MIDLDSLNPEQYEAVNHVGSGLVLATAGSGKTKTMAVKAAKILLEGGTVAAVTFTKDSAQELATRIIKEAGEDSRARLLVGTFHSVCLLMAFPKKAKLFGRAILSSIKSPFDIPWKLVSTGIQNQYVNQALLEVGLKLKWDEAKSHIEKYKESGLAEDEHIRTMCATYCSLMESGGLIDFQDIILKTVLALENKTLSTLPVDALLVDEYQDVDNLQYRLIRAHGIAGVAVTAVGDDDQSIYLFRNALGYDGFKRFNNEFAPKQTILGMNYRCRKEILECAARLILRNTERIPKRIESHKGEGGYVAHYLYSDRIVESEKVADEAAIALEEGASFAVIARTNNELLAVEQEILFRNIPYRKAEGGSIFDRPEIQVYIAIMKAVDSGKLEDLHLALLWAGLSSGDLTAIKKLFGSNVIAGATSDFQNTDISDASKRIWRDIARHFSQWRVFADNKCFELLNEDVFKWLYETKPKKAVDSILEIGKKIFQQLDVGIRETLREIERKQKSLDKPDDSKNPVYLITAHGSKGLEFDRVWIIGLENNIFPSEKSSLEEERRLFFVALTRAKEMLFVSSTKENKISEFVAEAGLPRIDHD
jgi:superfamily I DNA/RNA helicase